VSLIKIGIPLLAGLSVVHGLVPPHPGPLLAIGIFHADIGKTIFYGLIVALPTAIIAGPLFGNFISRYIPGTPSQELMDQIAKESDQGNLPSFTITLVTVLLPVVLMLLKTFADVVLPAEHIVRQWMDLIGHPITALLAALLLAFHTFGSARGFNRQQIMKMLDQSLAPTRGDRADRGCRRRLQADAGRHRRGQRDRADGRAGGDFADHAGLAGSGGNPHRHRFRDGRHHHRCGHRRTGDRPGAWGSTVSCWCWPPAPAR
jgi:H+/gluconate symporter and related permeases